MVPSQCERLVDRCIQSESERTCSASYEALPPSAIDLGPVPVIAEWWTKKSLPWSSGVMNAKPSSSLNRFTAPVALWTFLPGIVCCENRC